MQFSSLIDKDNYLFVLFIFVPAYTINFYIMRIFSRILYFIFVTFCIALVAVHIPEILIWAAKNIRVYQWFLYGAAGYFVLRLIPAIRRNEKWLQTFSHELTHTLVSIMFFRKIHSFQAEAEGTGAVWHSGKRRFGSIFISLAPYCFPIFTYFFMILRILGSEEMFYIFDILIGLTAAFHFMCFWKQTGNYQTDIQGQGYARSYFFIIAWRLFNATIILLTVRMGIVDAVTWIFPEYWNTLTVWWETLRQWISMIGK